MRTQLLRATARGRILFTFNIRDYMALAEQYPQHAGILLAAQQSWPLAGLIAALDCMLHETTAESRTAKPRMRSKSEEENLSSLSEIRDCPPPASLIVTPS